MATYEEELDEVLKFDPIRQQKDQQYENDLNEALKFDPMRKPEGEKAWGPIMDQPPVGQAPLGGGDIKPEAYAPTTAQIQTIFADNPEKQIDIYSQAMGIPRDRFRPWKGDIIYRNSQGRWQPVTDQSVIGIIKNAGVQVANPSVSLGTVGAIVGGGPGAFIGASAGELLRQGIGAATWGNKAGFDDPLMNTFKALTQGVIGGVAEGVPRAIQSAIIGHQIKKTGLKAGARALRLTDLSPRDQVKAEMMRDLAGQFNIDLPLHQAYDKASLEGFWMYLRKHPATADRVREIENTLSRQGDEALNRFITDLRGNRPFESPLDIGEQVQKAATGAIQDVVESRARTVQPIYETAFQEAELAGGIDTQPVLDMLDNMIKNTRVPKERAIYQQVKKTLSSEIEPVKPKPKEPIIRPEWTLEPEEKEGTWQFRSFVKKIGGIAVDDPSYAGEIKDISRGAKWQPGVLSSKRKGGNMMDELLAKIRESGQWKGIIESENDILDALATNPSNKGYFRSSTSNADINAYYEGKSLTTQAGREWKAAAGLRKQQQPEAVKPTIVPESNLRIIHRAKLNLNDMIEGTHTDIQDISPSLQPSINRNLMAVKSKLIEQIGEKAPTFLEADARFAELSDPINNLKKSIVGRLAGLQKDTTTANAIKTLFTAGKSDAEILRRARSSLEPQDPGLWDKMVSSYIGDIYDSIVIPVGDPLQAFQQFRRQMSSSKQKALLEAAMGSRRFQVFDDLMTVLDRATVGTRGQSMTHQFGEMKQAIAPPSGSKVFEFLTDVRRTAVEGLVGRWNDFVTWGRHTEMLDAMLDKEAVKKLGQLKKLTPGSQRLIDGISAYMGTVLPKIDLENIGQRLPPDQQLPQRSGQLGQKRVGR